MILLYLFIWLNVYYGYDLYKNFKIHASKKGNPVYYLIAPIVMLAPIRHELLNYVVIFLMALLVISCIIKTEIKGTVIISILSFLFLLITNNVMFHITIYGILLLMYVSNIGSFLSKNKKI